MNMVVRLVLVAGLPALAAFGGLGRTDWFDWFRAAGYGIMVHYLADAEVSVSPDGQEWRTLAEQENANSDRTELKFPVVNARFVRFAALKPDGEGQPGEQMAIAEIDIR